MKQAAIQLIYTGIDSIQRENQNIYWKKVLDHGPMSISQMGFNQLHPSHPLNSLLTV